MKSKWFHTGLQEGGHGMRYSHKVSLKKKAQGVRNHASFEPQQEGNSLRWMSVEPVFIASIELLKLLIVTDPRIAPGLAGTDRFALTSLSCLPTLDDSLVRSGFEEGNKRP
jgi:hypothetical protein